MGGGRGVRGSEKGGVRGSGRVCSGEGGWITRVGGSSGRGED